MTDAKLDHGVTCPVAERLARRGFYLPSGLALTWEQAQHVAAAVRHLVARPVLLSRP